MMLAECAEFYVTPFIGQGKIKIILVLKLLELPPGETPPRRTEFFLNLLISQRKQSAQEPGASKDDASLFETAGGFMEQINASIQRGCSS